MTLGQHAIVIGAGIGGLAVAGVLADFFERVTLVERDFLPLRASPRPGVPQCAHGHALLQGGLNALNSIFQDFSQSLVESGAVALRGGLDIHFEIPGYDPYPVRDLGRVEYGTSRPLIEHVIRQRLLQHANVMLHSNRRVLEIMPAADGLAVGGVRWRTADGVTETLPADLVVDASGRGALTRDLLKAMKRPEPEQTVVGIDMEYMSTSFAIPDQPRDWKVMVTLPDFQEHSRTGYLLGAEGDRWQAIIGERHLASDRSASIDGFRELARTLRTQTIYNAIAAAEPLDTVHRFKFPENVWYHFDRSVEFPERLLPLGDAMCRFNPIYGQGMTVAVQEAAVLKTLLQQRAHKASPLTGLQHSYLAATVAVIEAAWSQSVIPDFIHPSTRGERPADLDNRLHYVKGLNKLGARDPSVHKLLDRVRNLLESPAALRDPELVRRVEAEMASA